MDTYDMSATPDAIRKLWTIWRPTGAADEPAWATLQRLRKSLEANGARISIPEDPSFETEGEAIEAGLKRTIAGRDMVMRSCRNRLSFRQPESRAGTGKQRG
jgi:hypothetical protein